jgi:hypothetical protein
MPHRTAERQMRVSKTGHTNHGRQESTGGNSTYPKGGVSCSKDSFVVNQTLVFQIKFCGKSPALRVAAKRWEKMAYESCFFKTNNWPKNIIPNYG